MSSPKTRFTVVMLSCVTGLSGCTASNAARSVVPSYDDYTRRLLQLSADQNGDGRIDRWEYFDADGRLSTVGSSSRGDGVEDTWSSTTATAAGETEIDRSSRRDRVRDRHEFYKGPTLLRTEEDTNEDGLIDQWNRYEGPVLREVAFDLSFSKGRPDRRSAYDARGRFTGVEIDPDGDGTFVAAPGEPEKPRRPGVTK